MTDGPTTHLAGIAAYRRARGSTASTRSISSIGVGGMGEIYKGHAIQTGDPVAIKLMLPELAENEAALALFRKEASALHYLQHEAIVRYYVFTIEPMLQRPYLAMEFVDGRSLSAILQDDGPLPFEAVHVADAADRRRPAGGARARHHPSRRHRPTTSSFRAAMSARAKIIDFGIARSTQLSEATVIGSGFAGKYNYVSPEQLGLFGGDVTAKSDIYSLGLVLVQALTGRALDMGGTQFQIVEKRRKVPDLGGDRHAHSGRCSNGCCSRSPRTGRNPWPRSPPGRWARRASLRGLGSGDAMKPATAARSKATGRKLPWRYAVSGLVVTAVVAGLAAAYHNRDLLMSFFTSSKTTTQETRARGRRAAGRKRAEPPASRIEKIKRYVEHYDGGDCFFVTPIAIGENRATIEGLGASVQPFSNLDAAFKRENGFEADISVRQITPPQCPAVTFLGRLRDERSRAPRLDVDNVNLRNGDTLTGLVDRFGSRNIELLLVSDAGAVQQRIAADETRNGRQDVQHRNPGCPRRARFAAAASRRCRQRTSAGCLASHASDGGGSVLSRALERSAAKRTGALGTARYFKVER